MSAVTELINQLCPNGVEYKTLGEVFDFYNGYTPSKSNGDFWTNGSIPWFRLDDIRENGRILADAIQHVSRGAVKGELFPADSLIVSTSATIGEYALITVPAITNQRFVVLHPKNEYEGMIDSHFLLYVGSEIGMYCKKYTNQGNFASVDMGAFRRFQIPVPPLPVQQEIVRRLDAMTGLIEDLEKELAARQKQYEWVREETFKQLEAEGVERKKLGEIASDVYRGNGILRTQVTDSGVECVRYGEIYTEYNVWFEKCVSHTRLKYVTSPKSFEHGDLLFAITGEKVEEIGKCVAYVGMESCLAGGDIVVMKHSQDAKYLAYALSTHDAQAQKSRGKVKSKVVHSSVPELKKVLVPVPSLLVQQKIVRRLDEMTELIAAIEKEIALRKEQYEYCRERLLTFSRAG